MSIQRFDIRGDQWGLVERQDGLGAFCYYDDAARLRRHYVLSLLVNVVVILVCAVLAALLVHEKAARSPVVVPMAAGERMGLLSEFSAMRAELARKNELLARERQLRANYREQIQNLNGKIRAAGSHAEIVQERSVIEEIRQVKKLEARTVTPQKTINEAQRILGVRIVRVEP